MIEQRPSDYHFKDFRPEIKLFPDMVPVVGLITSIERERKRVRKSLTDFYLGNITKEDILLLGVANWPEATNKEANLRSIILAGRNAAFAVYHFIAVPAILELVSHFTKN